MAARRTSGDGGLAKKTGHYTEADGQKVPYTFWQASKEVPVELLPQGMKRKRVTGSGETKQKALTVPFLFGNASPLLLI